MKGTKYALFLSILLNGCAAAPFAVGLVGPAHTGYNIMRAGGIKADAAAEVERIKAQDQAKKAKVGTTYDKADLLLPAAP
jgi:sulfite reductase beta subunit-like hemoprotein